MQAKVQENQPKHYNLFQKNNYNESHHGRENFFENFRKKGETRFIKVLKK